MMKWIKVPKETATQPQSGTYRDWKGIIAEEGSYQCVYCAIGEASFGGTRNLHVEHYKPRKTYPDLENDIKNLFYACPVCNSFKGDSFPAEPLEDHSIACYPNPSLVDYNNLFDLDMSLGLIEGKYIASRYLATRLHLNRPQLVIERRVIHVFDHAEEALEAGHELLGQLKEIQDKEKAFYFLQRLSEILLEIAGLCLSERKYRPYGPEDLR